MTAFLQTLPSLQVIDSHTGGEPTRLVLDGGPELGTGPLADRARRFQSEFDLYRSATVNEPRGSDVMVGALLVAPHDPTCHFGVIFFNNVGLLGMCGHGSIGVIASLAALGRVEPGPVRLDTPVGPVEGLLHPGGEVTLRNVASHRQAARVAVEVPGLGCVTGDVAWAGNWFFLVDQPHRRIEPGEVEALTDFAWRVRLCLNAQGHPEVDHVELFGPSPTPGVHGRNFVLCPGKAYDRSPCGTGTSAKLACLAADGKLAEGETWVQESVIGSTFGGQYRWIDRARGVISPSITGRAHVTGEARLYLDPQDPYRWGIRR